MEKIQPQQMANAGDRNNHGTVAFFFDQETPQLRISPVNFKDCCRLPEEIDTASTSTIPQHQDNPLAAVVDRIGWTKAQAARQLFPAENSRTVQRWITQARRLPDEHIPFIAYLLAITTNRSESNAALQAWLLSADSDGVSIGMFRSVQFTARTLLSSERQGHASSQLYDGNDHVSPGNGATVLIER